MSESAASPPRLEALARALAAAPDGVVVFDADWTISYVNPAGAGLLQRPVAELVGRPLWVALPGLGGTLFHSFLLHARTAGEPVTWQGFYPPAGRWLSATATTDDDLLHLYLRPAGDRLTERPPDRIEEQVDAQPGRDRLRFLAEISETLSAILETGESAAALAHRVVPRLADWAMVSVVADDGGPGSQALAHRHPAGRADLDAYLAGRIPGTGDDSSMVTALLSGAPVQLAPIAPGLVEPSLATEESRAAWRRLESTSATLVPLRARDETFGALVLVNTGSRPAHSELELALAVEIARHGALALDNARLYSRQLKVAETLQRSLLTDPPQPDDLQIAVRYRPAAAHTQVGGDWYDAFQQPDGATLLVIGDVVGHNVDAAAAMGQIRSILRGIACDRPGSPAQILTRVDRVLATLGVASLATALVARIEQTPEQAWASERTLRWSSAGHLPPLLLHPDGAVQLQATAPELLLGADSTSLRTDHEVQLRPGDTVLFVTDGLVEHGRTGIDEGTARLIGVLAELHGRPLEELCDQLLARIVTGHADDDIALLTVRCHPQLCPSTARDARQVQ